MPVDALREAALAVLLSTALQNDARPSDVGLSLPAGIQPMLPADLSTTRTIFGFGGTSWNTSQTPLSWAWFDGECERMHGRLTWPDSYDAGEAYADELLAVAEASFVEGPAPSLPPTAIRGRIAD
jgi:hypothetical protein